MVRQAFRYTNHVSFVLSNSHTITISDATQPRIWHCGEPFAEQRAAHTRGALLDLSHLDVLRITGDDASTWLNSLLAQQVDDMPASSTLSSQLRRAFLLNNQGHIEHDCWVARTDTGYLLTISHQHRDDLVAYLTSMVFWSHVTITPIPHTVLGIIAPYTVDTAPIDDILRTHHIVSATGTPRGLSLKLLFVPDNTPHTALTALLATGLTLTGSWAWDALRIEAGLTEMDTDTDNRSLPHEYDSVGHPDTGAGASVTKGCYRGQETVAKIHNVGMPPRRQVVLLLDGSTDARPLPGTELSLADTPTTTCGRIGTVADHWEYGPIALALVRRTVTDDAQLRWETDTDNGTATIIGELSTHPSQEKPGRAAIQHFQQASRHGKL